MRLVVDELPSGCVKCLFWSGMWCPLIKKPAPDSSASRLVGCPLLPIVEKPFIIDDSITVQFSPLAELEYKEDEE